MRLRDLVESTVGLAVFLIMVYAAVWLMPSDQHGLDAPGVVASAD